MSSLIRTLASPKILTLDNNAAFPSSHVGVTTVVMLLALRTRSKGLIFTILPFYILMCFSTVYIYAHYAIDAIAGLLTGILLYFALKALWKHLPN